jgi:phosphocarrier protein
MLKRKFVIVSANGIHSRPATSLVAESMKQKCEISLTAFGRTVNLKSIMGLLSLGVYAGEMIEIGCDGVDEEQALDSLTDYIVSTGLGRVEYE